MVILFASVVSLGEGGILTFMYLLGIPEGRACAGLFLEAFRC